MVREKRECGCEIGCSGGKCPSCSEHQSDIRRAIKAKGTITDTTHCPCSKAGNTCFVCDSTSASCQRKKS